MHFAVDLHIDLVEVPSPVGEGAHLLDPLSADFGSEHRTEPVPPKPYRFVAAVDAALGQQISTFRRDSGYFTYIITRVRMTSGELSK